MTQLSSHRRVNNGLLQALESPVLLWLAKRMPKRVVPDLLTGIGFVGSCVAAAGYLLARWEPAFLWLASAGLAINWFGDSLDGTLARFRKIERPRYGFFLDQNIDAFEQLLLAIGIAASGYVRPELAMGTLAVYFVMSILGLSRLLVLNTFSMTYIGIGLTELRIAFVILNAFMFFLPPDGFALTDLRLNYAEVLSLIWIGIMLFAFVTGMKHDLGVIAREEKLSS
jgi:phosphatidylglycerophosphate synthase